jgi:hypothetical protein
MVIDDNNTDVFVCAHLFGNSFKNRISKEVIADDSIAFSRGSSESHRRVLLVYFFIKQIFGFPRSNHIKNIRNDRQLILSSS